mgnify:CR=1 FL=1
MSRPPKPFSILKSEGRSHRTKSELEQRRKGEEALLTGVPIRERPEVKSNERAHAEFLKINKLLKKIEKNDALFEGVINRYCILVSECAEFEEKRERFYERMIKFEQIEDQLIENEMTYSEFYKMLGDFQRQIVSIDKQIQVKRRMLMDIEKENLMTIQSGLRIIPKKEDKGSSDPLTAALNGS